MGIFHFHAENWHPLTWISHAVDIAVWGLNPCGHHLTNVVIHGANTFIVVLLVLKLLLVARERAPGGTVPLFLTEKGAHLAAAVTGLLFGLHPLHVESVAWISERKDLLCGFFFLLGLHRYLQYAMKAPDPGRVRSTIFTRDYVLVCCCFIGALLPSRWR